ncbi:murein transglycosylase A [Blastomonas sp. AAP53]|uniref:murein transglycosylase A n=1 Tax=Blastomonas sp. AAP53 TaxID=1248760 RepID=UPI0002DBCD18|nr:murein transglycosylase A [Blastomonas sp. AAP53]
MRRLGLALLPLALAGCAGVVPSSEVSSAPASPSTRLPYESEPPSAGRAPAPATLPAGGDGGASSYVIPRATPLAAVAGAGIVASADIAQAAGQTLRRGPAIASLPIAPDDARAALVAFRLTCPSVTRRADASGLTRPEDWRAACEAAGSWSDQDAARFFADQFEAVQVGEGAAFATGYFEPEIAGTRTRQPGFNVPVYGRPADLIDVDLSQFSPDMAGKKIRGKVKGSDFVPYDDRTQIEQGTLNGRAPVIAWAADDIEFFFLQVQGSGRLRAPDGSVIRIGYASQNGRDYTGIGALMRTRGLLAPGQANMQGIVAWLRANPEEGRAIMRENKSFVFFRELTGPGPLGALGYQVEAGSSVAADPKFIPLGAPVFLSMDRAEPNGLWVAQDTGGAIKGANRFDTFWGAGDRARVIAGGMSARGLALILLPRGSFDRLAQQAR